MTNRQNKRKRRVIEIYFVLYLAALILLIPGREKIEDEETNNSLFQIPFSIKLEKQSLNALYLIDSVGLKAVKIDTSNTIFYTGNVKDIEYKFIIEDLQSKQNVTLESTERTQSQVFSFDYNSDRKAAKFKWNPNVQDRRSKSFVVTVIANAISQDSSTYGKTVEDKLKFNINLNIDYASNFQLLAQNQEPITPTTINQTSNNVIQNQGNILLLPREEVIQTIAYNDWENEITIFGLNPATDLRKQPDINIKRDPNDKIGGSAKIAGYRDNSIIIKGEAPGYGSLNVKITLIRHSDGMESSKEFRIVPQLIDEPEIPSKLYPLITYKINPKVPNVSGKNAYSILINNEGKTIARSQNSSDIVFTPQISDTGKTFVLERYLSGALFGQKYFIKVSSYPKPEIYRVTEMGYNQIRIFTNSYGFHNNAPNYINNIEVIDGNAKIREIIGAQQAPDNKNLLFKQVFEIIPKDQSKPFQFKIRAVANNGMKGEIVSYPKQ